MASYRVLVVDDNHEVRRMVTASLKTLGADIDVLDVPSAEEALFISASLPLDLVVLDFRLPGMSGIDMLSRLRKRRPETKIILVTGVVDNAIRQQIAAAGVEAYFFKPIEIDKFLQAVKHSLWADQAEATVPTNASEAPDALLHSTGEGKLPSLAAPGKPPSHGLVPTLDERMTTLKQQLRAVAVLLMDDAGQVLEVAGNPSQITSGSALLSSLMHAFRASLQVSQAMGCSTGTSLQYFASQRQCIYVAPVGSNHALIANTTGFFEPDKLATIDRYFQLAVRDLLDILATKAAEERAHQEDMEKQQAELPGQVTVDQETRERVDDLFATAAKSGGQEGADHFWESLADEEAQDGARGKDVLTYDQAQDMGFTPNEVKPA